MQVITLILRSLNAVLGLWLTVMLFYQLFITFFGFRHPERDYQEHDPQSRFLILVPAHNEEAVIGDIIHNLQNMDYPKELYDFFIVADNCTDHTAELARSMGAQVIETSSMPGEATGKPMALKKALASLGDYASRWDQLMIFDADNLMDPWMLREVNSQWLDKGKPDFIQCYLGCKNKSGVVAWFYYTSYTVTNRFFQLPKYRRGLNCAVGGTGFAINTDYLRERGGWDCCSLTEDFEIQVEATLEGRRVLWNHFARVYDEKPTSMRASIRQKIRWGQGHWYVCLHNTGPLFRALAEGKIGFREFLSTLTYMYSLSTYVVVLLQAIIAGLLLLIGTGKPPAFSELDLVWGGLLFAYSYIFLFYLSDWLDNRIPFRIRTLPLTLVSVLASTIVGLFNQVVGLMLSGHQDTWVKTEHRVTRQEADIPDA